MSTGKFNKDPFGLIIAGVGGQGNVVLSHVLGGALVREGYFVTIGETYGASQRGGSVMSHIQISSKRQYSPLIAEGNADCVLGMEPMETLRVITRYANPSVMTIVNPRPIYSIDVAAGRTECPPLPELLQAIRSLSSKLWVVDATNEAQRMGNPMMANTILIGALLGSGVLPLSKEILEPVLKEHFGEKYAPNMLALDKGMGLVKGA